MALSALPPIGKFDVAFVTAAEMPKPDPETHLLVQEAARRDLRAGILPWDTTFDWSTIPLVVIRTTWDYFKRLPEFLDWARNVEIVTRLINPYVVVDWNCHKGYLQALYDQNVSVVPTMIVKRGSTESISDLLSGLNWKEIIIKPAVSIGAIGALRCHIGDNECKNHLRSLLNEGDALIQPFVPSILTRGEVSLIFFDGVFSHAIQKLPASGEYRVQDHHGGTVHPYVPTAQELEVSYAALAASPAHTIYARVDLVDLDNTPVVMELELIEPALFLASSLSATKLFIKILRNLIAS
jgi:glutathione synthase/RimK-type ligase-like ATP-grasp enzyme